MESRVRSRQVSGEQQVSVERRECKEEHVRGARSAARG